MGSDASAPCPLQAHCLRRHCSLVLRPIHRAVAGTRAESIIKHDQLSLSLLRASCSRQRLAVHSVRNRRCTSRPTVASRIIQRRRL